MKATSGASRRPHAKSRTGCLKCKARHVRCDESGPPCGRCQIRKDDCLYANPPSTVRNTDAHTSVNHKAEVITPASLPSPAIVYPDDSKLLQLQLMHRWTVTTYKCCCSPGTQDDEVWQSWVPQSSIRHNFLLYGILSLTSFEMAKLAQSPYHKRYINSATEYHGLALSTFRTQVSAIGPEDIDAAVCMSLMLLVLSFASVQIRTLDSKHDSIVQTVLSHFELIRGCVPIIESKKDYISQNQYLQKLVPFAELSRFPLDPLVEDALVKLVEINDRRITASVHDTSQRRVQQIGYWEICKIAVASLRALFEKCTGDTSRGYALGYLNMVGESYVQAVKDGDTCSLLILMYWGVLLHKCGRQIWWAQDFGSSLVDEIAKSDLFDEADTAIKGLIVQATHYTARG